MNCRYGLLGGLGLLSCLCLLSREHLLSCERLLGSSRLCGSECLGLLGSLRLLSCLRLLGSLRLLSCLRLLGSLRLRLLRCLRLLSQLVGLSLRRLLRCLGLQSGFGRIAGIRCIQGRIPQVATRRQWRQRICCRRRLRLGDPGRRCVRYGCLLCGLRLPGARRHVFGPTLTAPPAQLGRIAGIRVPARCRTAAG